MRICSRSGIKWGEWDSEGYINQPNGTAIGNLISHIGDKNALVIKKAKDELTPFLDNNFQNRYSDVSYNLYITFLTPGIERLKGAARLKTLQFNALEMVRLIDVVILDTKFEMIKANDRNKNEPAKMFYSFLLNVGKVEFLFKGKDW